MSSQDVSTAIRYLDHGLLRARRRRSGPETGDRIAAHQAEYVCCSTKTTNVIVSTLLADANNIEADIIEADTRDTVL